MLVTEAYRVLLIISSFLVSLAHGSNDVANTISQVIVVAKIHDLNTDAPFYLGGTGIALGLMCLGFRVMETVGKKVVKLDYERGFCA